ncbi:DUF885 domain-containing protein [Rubinisphaera sp.]|uniref:DUF885 domain-containing protein n=1 Tax=Rubinisphaera sp. TaxID=2024857 RepID=UPI000C0D5B19|nr:DUF885 domain-containing protein [Rubinisphaera sp.]MBV09454.1 DUF885 domain-containing protein [Rubinisphaera sp.]HCS52829.1 DUF885 domain-containing protein [Planctomycetaceae bacterium]
MVTKIAGLKLFIGLLLSLCLLPQIAQADATEDFHQWLDDHWEWNLKTNPLKATYLGDKRYNDRWPDLSLETLEKNNEQLKAYLKRVKAIDPSQLEGEDVISYKLFERQLSMEIEGFPFGWHFVPLNQRGGLQTENEQVEQLPFETVKDYENWLARMESFDVYADQTTALMQAGVDRGIVHSKVIMNRLPAQIRRQIVDEPEKSLFWKAFQTFPKDFTQEEREQLQERARKAIQTVIVPTFEQFEKFFLENYYPACFDEVGFKQIPNGQEFYAYRARLYTTTDMTPQEIHDIGLSEVRRIRQQMEAIMKEVEFEGSFGEFLEYLRTDPKFYYEDPNELFQAVEAVCKRIDPQLVKLFKTLPRMPYGVRPIPESIAPDTTAAYYMGPAADGTRAGNYYFNTYKPDQRPKYTIEALSLHEAVPGHHLQIALAMELDDIPAFRRLGGYTAFIEGWGLYSESLGSDLGLYQDPYSRFGQLTYEMWRAIRLVVDTGMHSLDWTRDDAIQLFVENTAKSRLDIENEVDRYIAWPGQALAYKIGELKIQELRKRAETELGDKFDIREFHEAVLSHGAVTLDVLEGQIEDYIASKKK